MAMNLPTTDWRRTSGNGELGNASGNIVTISGNQITTLGGINLVILDGSYTAVPSTIWETLEPLPVSLWQPNDTRDEFSGTSPSDIVDTLDNNLVDILGNHIVDTGVIDTALAATEWAEDDSL